MSHSSYEYTLIFHSKLVLLFHEMLQKNFLAPFIFAFKFYIKPCV